MIAPDSRAAAPRRFRCAAVLFLLPVFAHAAPLRVDGAPCAAKITVHAEAVPLGDVVKAVTTALDVRLEIKTPLSDPVSLDRSGPPEKVLGDMLRGRNLVLDSNPSARCHGRSVLTTVWILPAGQNAPAKASAAVAPAADEAQLQPFNPGRPLPPKFRQRIGHKVSREEWRQITKDWHDGKLDIDPVTGKIVPVQPNSPKATQP